MLFIVRSFFKWNYFKRIILGYRDHYINRRVVDLNLANLPFCILSKSRRFASSSRSVRSQFVPRGTWPTWPTCSTPNRTRTGTLCLGRCRRTSPDWSTPTVRRWAKAEPFYIQFRHTFTPAIFTYYTLWACSFKRKHKCSSRNIMLTTIICF